MGTLGAIGFTAPWLLWGLLALPILWILLRAVPPAPIRRRFPGVALLLGLDDRHQQTDRTPWWLLLLRMLAVAAVIVGFAGPVINPQAREPGSGPLLIVLDGSWADAGDWARRQDRVAQALSDAARAGRPVALVLRTALTPVAPEFLSADRWASRLAGLAPQPWSPQPEAQAAFVAALGKDRFETLWISNGIADPARADMLTALEAHGPVRVMEGGRAVLGLLPAVYEDGVVQLTALCSGGAVETDADVAAICAPGSSRARADRRHPPC